jgi:MFS family permease
MALFICLMGTLIMGGIPYFYNTETPEFILLGLILFGISLGFLLVPALPEYIESDKEEYGYKITQKQVLMLSGLNTTVIGLGRLIGSYLASLLEYYFGFQMAFQIMSFVIIFMILFYFFMLGNFKIFTSPR